MIKMANAHRSFKSVPLDIETRAMQELLRSGDIAQSTRVLVKSALYAQNYGAHLPLLDIQGTMTGRFTSHEPSPPSNIGTKFRMRKFVDKSNQNFAIIDGFHLPNYYQRDRTRLWSSTHDSIYVETASIPETQSNAGYAAACGRCRFGLACMRQRYPNVCGCCRTVSIVSRLPLWAKTQAYVIPGALGPETDEAAIGYEMVSSICTLKNHAQIYQANIPFRVASACPLAHVSELRCPICRKKGPVVTRIRVQDARQRYRHRLLYSIKRQLSPKRSFKDSVALHQKGSHGHDLHQRSEQRYRARRRKSAKLQQPQKQRSVRRASK